MEGRVQNTRLQMHYLIIEAVEFITYGHNTLQKVRNRKTRTNLYQFFKHLRQPFCA